VVAKRTPKRVGVHEVYSQRNSHGEWSNVVYPEGLQIDTFHHKGKKAHLHPPGDYDHAIDLPGLTFERAQAVLREHLSKNDQVKLDDLVKELRTK
jgi:hypothetical protein